MQKLWNNKEQGAQIELQKLMFLITDFSSFWAVTLRRRHQGRHRSFGNTTTCKAAPRRSNFHQICLIKQTIFVWSNFHFVWSNTRFLLVQMHQICLKEQLRHQISLIKQCLIKQVWWKFDSSGTSLNVLPLVQPIKHMTFFGQWNGLSISRLCISPPNYSNPNCTTITLSEGQKVGLLLRSKGNLPWHERGSRVPVTPKYASSKNKTD